MSEHNGFTAYLVAGEYDGFSIKRIGKGIRICLGWVAIGILPADMESMISRGSEMTVNRVMLKMHQNGARYCVQHFEKCGAYGDDDYTIVTVRGEEHGELLRSVIDSWSGETIESIRVDADELTEAQQ